MKTKLALLGVGMTLAFGAADPAFATGTRQVLATGPLVKGSTNYPNAVLTYDSVLDASDAGSNPGLEVWPSPEAEAAGTGRLARSNDNNGQWDYDPAGAFFANGKVSVYGTRTGSHGPQGSVWTSGNGSFLVRATAEVSCGSESDGIKRLGDFEGIRKGNAEFTAYVEHAAADDAAGVGPSPGLTVKTGVNNLLWRANDNNGQWDYRIDCAYAFDGVIYITGGRKSNSGTGQPFNPRVWETTPTGGSFLRQSTGF